MGAVVGVVVVAVLVLALVTILIILAIIVLMRKKKSSESAVFVHCCVPILAAMNTGRLYIPKQSRERQVE